MNITTGQINNKYVKQFLKCLIKCEGSTQHALQLAFDKYDRNAAATTTESDSWHEAIAQFGGQND